MGQLTQHLAEREAKGQLGSGAKTATEMSEPGLTGKMMTFLRNDISEVQSAAARLAETADGLFGPVPSNVEVAGKAETPSCVEAELVALMEQSAIARNYLHDQVNRLAGRL